MAHRVGHKRIASRRAYGATWIVSRLARSGGRRALSTEAHYAQHRQAHVAYSKPERAEDWNAKRKQRYGQYLRHTTLKLNLRLKIFQSVEVELTSIYY